MMESCFNDRLEKIEAVSIEDLKKDLSGEFLSMSSVTSEESSLQEREHLQVYLRIRPFTQAEMDSDESQECISIENPDKVFLKAPRSSLSSRLSDKSLPQTAQRFQFSQVYGPGATQKEVFDGTVKSLVKDFLQGGNSLVFTYGVTNAGKTFTFLGPENNSGLLPRSLNMIFNNIQDKIYTEMDIKPQRCREYMRLNKEQLMKEIANKKTILRLAKECDLQKSMIAQLNSTSKSAILEGTAVNNTEELDSESFTLDMNSHSKFSVWVSFCEIYNENIYDLLETIPNNSMKRSTLRLSQDVKGNPFVKDLKWVQVSDADEAYKVLKLGKKHQSFSCTKLNHLSSRSHSIFSIRILQIEDLGIPRVQNISELSLCDLAGSERCAKTQNKGERLKEAGNINSSLLILGKCLKALRHNQQSKLLQHIPFRESKLTHYLQGFFCGRGKACMIVNINQCASMFDETLNVLKFSALAQKVVVLNTTKLAPVVPKKSAREVSFIINNADKMRFWRKRRSSLIGWDTSLEDVQENDDGEEKEEEESLEETMEDVIQEEEEEEEEEEFVVSKESYEKLLSVIEELKKKIVEERSEKLLLESRIREDVSQEFMQLYSQMESDFSERLENEREIIEERAETRMEILKNLVCKKNDQHNVASEDAKQPQEDQIVVLDGIIGCMQDDLVSIKKDAEAAQNCLIALPDLQEKITQLEIKVAKLSEEKNKTEELLSLKTKEVEAYFSNQTNDQLEEAKRSLECQNEKLQGLMEICQEKDEMISKLQTALDHWEETVAKNKTSTDAIKEEILNLKINCTCSGSNNPSSGNESRKRPCDAFPDPEGQPPLKKGPPPEENHCVTTPKMDELQAELNLKEMEVEKLKLKVDELQQQLGSLRRHFQDEIKLKDEVTEKIKDQLLCSEQKVKELSDNLQQQVSSYEATVTAWQEQRDANQKIAAQKEKVANEMSDLRQEATQKEVLLKNMEDAVRAQTEKFEKVSAELSATKDLLRKLEVDFNEKLQLVESLTNQTERLKHELEASRVLAAKRDSGHFHDTIGALRAECEKVVKESALKSQQIVDLEQEVSEFKRQIAEQDKLSSQLKRELDGVNSANAEFNSKEDLVNQLRDQLESASKQLESERQHVAEIQQRYSALEATSVNLRGEIRDLEEQLQVSKSNVDKVVALEQQLSGKESLIAELQSSLEEAQSKLKGATSSLSLQAAKLKEAEQSMESLRLVKETIAEKDTQLGKREQELLRLKEEMSDKLLTIKSLNLDLGKKEEDASDLKEKVADAKKQIQQVEKEISTLREENRTLKQKLSEMEKGKNQMMNDLKSRDQTIQLLKSEQSNAIVKSDQNLELYQKACKDLHARQQIIEDMRLALTEQEETQAEQDRVLEAKMEEIESLTSEVENMKNKFNQNKSDGMAAQNLDEHNSDAELARQEVAKLKESFQIANEKYQADRKKWQEDKFMLIKQTKEAEERRNHDVKRFAEDRERYTKQQIEMESLRKQLAEKDNDLERWRKERDDLVEALDVQLRNLILSNQQKDNELEKLRADATFMAGKASNGTNTEDLQRILTDKESEISKLKEQLRILTEPNSKLQPAETDRKLQKLEEVKSANKTNSMLFQDGNNLKSSNKYNTSSSEESEALGNNQSVLDSSGISSESGRTSRFPKPELEIQFTPLRPNKMEVKMQGEDSAVTVKLGKSARKRKSNEMEMDLVESENRKNSRKRTIAINVKEQSPAANRNVASLKQQVSSSSLKSANKKDGPLQKIGDFIQSSPTFLQSKAKKLIGTLSSRSPEPELGPVDIKPKRSKRKLYKTEISSPLDIPSHPIVGLDRDEKESDHLIIKRRLRPRTAKR